MGGGAGGTKPLTYLGPKQVRHEEVHQGPQLHQRVLQRGAREQQPAPRRKRKQRLPTLRFEVLDVVGLVQDEVVPAKTEGRSHAGTRAVTHLLAVHTTTAAAAVDPHALEKAHHAPQTGGVGQAGRTTHHFLRRNTDASETTNWYDVMHT